MGALRYSIKYVLCVQVFISLVWYSEGCLIDPLNIGFGNLGLGNIGFFNLGVGNSGLANHGVGNAGIGNTGVAQLGLRNIGVMNFGTLPNSVSVLNVPVAPNVLPTGRRRRRSLVKYAKGKFFSA